MKIYNVGNPFQRVSVDAMGPFRESANGNRYLVTLYDPFSKWPEAIPVPDLKAQTVASAPLYVFTRFGLPQEIHTDCAAYFKSSLSNEIVDLLNIRHTQTTPLHPQSNPVERMNQTLRQHLALMIDDRQSDWDKQAQIFLMGYRALPHATTGISPAMLMFGRHLTLPADLEFGVPFHDTVQKYSGESAKQLQETLRKLHELTRQNIKDATFQTKFRYDSRAKLPDFQQDDIVWLYKPRKTGGLTRKLQTSWEGPFRVVRKINDIVFQIRRTSNSKILTVHADRLRLVERPSVPPPPALVFNPKKVSANMIGLRSRKRNARRVFPLLTVVVENSSPLTACVLPSDPATRYPSKPFVFIPTPTSTRKGPHLFLHQQPGTQLKERLRVNSEGSHPEMEGVLKSKADTVDFHPPLQKKPKHRSATARKRQNARRRSGKSST